MLRQQLVLKQKIYRYFSFRALSCKYCRFIFCWDLSATSIQWNCFCVNCAVEAAFLRFQDLWQEVIWQKCYKCSYRLVSHWSVSAQEERWLCLINFKLAVRQLHVVKILMKIMIVLRPGRALSSLCEPSFSSELYFVGRFFACQSNMLWFVNQICASLCLITYHFLALSLSLRVRKRER